MTLASEMGAPRELLDLHGFVTKYGESVEVLVLYGYFQEHASKAGLSFLEFAAPLPPGRPSRKNAARYALLAEAVADAYHTNDFTLEEIGLIIGRSRQRVHELLRAGPTFWGYAS